MAKRRMLHIQLIRQDDFLELPFLHNISTSSASWKQMMTALSRTPNL